MPNRSINNFTPSLPELELIPQYRGYWVAIDYQKTDIVTFTIDGITSAWIANSPTELTDVPGVSPLWDIYSSGTQGGQGDPGLSAYEVWLAEGNIGTEQDFLDSLKGDKGDPGFSAYEVWLDEGNIGSEADFLASLEGTDGIDGNPGPPGFNWRGQWLNVETYQIRDAVQHLGRSFVSLIDNNEEEPPNTPTSNLAWSLVVDKGADGQGTGDMLKSVYDPDDDGKVVSAVNADNADVVPWAGITGKPAIGDATLGTVQNFTANKTFSGTVTFTQNSNWTSGAPQVGGQNVWHPGNFDPATKLDVTADLDARNVMLKPVATNIGAAGKVVRMAAGGVFLASYVDTPANLHALFIFDDNGKPKGAGSSVKLAGMVQGQHYWLGANGALLTAPPTPTAVITQVYIGVGLDTSTLYFNPQRPIKG